MVFFIGLNESYRFGLNCSLWSLNLLFNAHFMLLLKRFSNVPHIRVLFLPLLLWSSNPLLQIRDNKKKKQPTCTQYGLLGHTIDWCYKLHGYPPICRNQKTYVPRTEASTPASSKSSDGLTHEQCQGLLTLLQS